MGYRVAGQRPEISQKNVLFICCHAAQTYSSIFAAEQNTDHRRKKCPPQEKSLFAYFFGVVKSKASVGTRPDGVAFCFYNSGHIKEHPPARITRFPPVKQGGLRGWIPDYTIENDENQTFN